MASSRMQELGLAGSAEGTKPGVKPVGVMAAFKKEQDKINDACQQIAEATRNIQNLIERFSKATKSSEEDEISAELEGIVKKTQAVAMQTKALIKRLNEENKDSSKFGHNEKVIREQGIKASAEKFIKRVKEYQIAQQMFNTRMKDTMTRRVRIIAPDKSEEDVKRIIDEGKSSEIFKQVILEGKGQLASTYRDVMDTHQDLVMLQRQMEQLKDMFIDLNMLVERQGEQIDNIEFQVNMAGDYMEKGIKQLDSAKKSQKKSRKYICFLLLAALVVLIIVCIPILSNAANTA